MQNELELLHYIIYIAIYSVEDCIKGSGMVPDNIITDIKVQKNNKDRCNIFVDLEYSFSLSAEMIIKYGIQKGQSIALDEIRNAIEEDNSKEAFNKALNYISYMLRSEKEIEDYLVKKGYDEETIVDAIAKLREYKFLDDKQYAVAFINTMKAKKSVSKRELEYKLAHKGIKKEIIEQVIDDAYGYDQELEAVMKLVEKYYKKYRELDENKITYKVKSAIFQKGFSTDIIEDAIHEYKQINE